MIRTDTVSLTKADAVAYRQKLPAGGSGIVVVRSDCPQPGIASISKTSGEPFPTANTQERFYPRELFMEAMELTAGLPYRKQGSVKNIKDVPEELKEDENAAAAEEIIVDSEDYRRIVEYFTDKNGKLSYELLNRDMIRFANRSSVVRRMIADNEKIDGIRLYVTGSKFRSICGNGDLTDEQVLAITELLDEVSPKGVFREFNGEIRRKLQKK
ncbi:MAG: hypothetical protein J5822_09245 [Eubacteriaceae bacterium]|nr:hypothetical protein [Eubacteriaceae bacterium]